MNVIYTRLRSPFEGTLSAEKYARFRSEFQRNSTFYRRLYYVGTHLSNQHAPLSRVDTLQWSGPLRQAATTSAANDLFAANIPISVKAQSNVVANLSPFNLLESIPQGSAPAIHEENWFLRTAPGDFQALYRFVRITNSILRHLPTDVSLFERAATRDERKLVQLLILDLSPSGKRLFNAPCCLIRKSNRRAIIASSRILTEEASTI